MRQPWTMALAGSHRDHRCWAVMKSCFRCRNSCRPSFACWCGHSPLDKQANTLSRCLVTSNVKCFFFLAGKVTLNVAFAAYPKLENDSPCEILPFPDSAVTPTMKNCFCVTGCEMFVDAWSCAQNIRRNTLHGLYWMSGWLYTNRLLQVATAVFIASQFCDELGVNCKLLWYRCEKSSRFRLMVFKSVFVPLRRYIFHVCCSFALWRNKFKSRERNLRAWKHIPFLLLFCFVTRQVKITRQRKFKDLKT